MWIWSAGINWTGNFSLTWTNCGLPIANSSTSHRMADKKVVKLTAEEAFDLGNRVRDAAIGLHKWRIENRDHLSRAQWEELDDREVTLLNFASSNFTNGIGMVLDDTRTPLSRLQAGIEHAKSAIGHIRSFKQA